MTGWLVLRTFGALALVLAMLAGALWAVRRFDMRLPGGTGAGRGRTRRIETLERIPLDAKRALILVRADAMEHLILLAPDTNVLIASREAGSDIDAVAPGAEQSWQDALSAAVARLANPAPAVAPPPAPLPSSPLSPVAPPPPVPAPGPPVHVISAAIETDLVFARPLPAPPARPAKRAAKPAKPAKPAQPTKPATPRRPVASAAKAPARPRAAAPAAKAAGKSVGQSARSAKSATSAKAAKAPAARRRPAAR